MRIVFENVEPIKIGFAIIIEVGFSVEFWDAEQLATDRIRASFRQDGEVIWTADSQAGTLLRPGNRKFEMSLPADATALMLPKHATFDFIRGDGDDARAVPGRFHWPVDIQVTNNA